jgi:hypothetical protein
MLDLESLFSSQPAPAAVSSLTPANDNTGHSGHNGNTPVFYQVCPPKSLQHNGFSHTDTADTSDTVDFQGGGKARQRKKNSAGAKLGIFMSIPERYIIYSE